MSCSGVPEAGGRLLTDGTWVTTRSPCSRHHTRGVGQASGGDGQSQGRQPHRPPNLPTPMPLFCYGTVAILALSLTATGHSVHLPLWRVGPGHIIRKAQGQRGHLPMITAGTYLEGDIVCSQYHVLRKILQALSHSVGSWTRFTPTAQHED